jgi:endogenous inhibitor of DNA gyrase (YacG/DUF329 family)
MAAHCPICRREIKAEGNPFRPFCSERCKLIDLDHWLSGRYCIIDPILAPSDEGNESKTDDAADGDAE